MKYLSLIVSLALTTMVFSFSAATGDESASLSLTIAQAVAEVLHRIVPTVPIDLDSLHLFIRKLAHMSEYFLIGISYAVTFHLFKWKGWILFLAGVMLAFADEGSQFFAEGRGPSVFDALIFDIPGFVFGALGCRYIIQKKLSKLNVS